MRWIFLFLLLFFIFVIGTVVYKMLPEDTSDMIRESVGNITGYKKPFLPNKLMKELHFLKFGKIYPDAVQYIYCYKIESSGEKRIVCIVTDPDSRIFLDKIEQTDFLYESDTNKVCHIKLYPGQTIPPLLIQSESKPETFIGKVYTTNETNKNEQKRVSVQK